ncbi:MAG: hypothetical protein NC097_00235 [Clostridium sp.]|nr:hypothetical protein [Prevotella sp.]MCM1428210.1 hypothetical protein [Clostridium sp.]MCM1475941.1 hypothetical protein [Muribaculaceae bacterium]
MNNLLKSKIAAGILLILVIAAICLTFSMRQAWWCFIDIFFAFMMAFCHLLSLTMQRMSPIACVKLDKGALVFGILAVLSFIGEYITMQIVFN